MSTDRAAIEYRVGTPTLAAHRAHGDVGESGRFVSVWRVEGEPLPRITLDGRRWSIAGMNRVTRGVAPFEKWHPTGDETWTPCDVNTLDPVAWKTPPSGAEALTTLGGTDVVAWRCTGCGTIHVDREGSSRTAQQAAMQCCGVSPCQWDETPCDRHASQGHRYCGTHERDAADRRELARFTAAVKLTPAEWDGPVFCPDCEPDGEGYYADVGEFLDECADNRNTAYLYACDIIVPSWDAGHVIESAMSEMHEGARDRIGADDAERLQAVLDAWSKTLDKAETWTPDYERVVVLSTEST